MRPSVAPKRSCAEVEERLRGGFEEQVEEEPTVAVDEEPQFGGQGEDDVEVVGGEDPRHVLLDPGGLGEPWHLGQCRLRQEL